MPSVCWGMGAQVHNLEGQVTLWFRRDQSVEFCSDVSQTGRISVIFEVPVTNASLQLKGRNAMVRETTPGDAPRLRAHVDNMVRELGNIGLDENYCRTIFEQDIDDLIAIEFTAESVFDQTPGPRAGRIVRRPV